jgi:hypothetical protein
MEQALEPQRILECLKVYDAMESWSSAQTTVHVKIKAICDKVRALVMNADQIVQPTANLANIYDHLISELQDLHALFDLAEEVSPRFALLEAVVIPCVTEAIRVNLGRMIFSAGRPDELHRVSVSLAALIRTTPSQWNYWRILKRSLPQRHR